MWSGRHRSTCRARLMFGEISVRWKNFQDVLRILPELRPVRQGPGRGLLTAQLHFPATRKPKKRVSDPLWPSSLLTTANTGFLWERPYIRPGGVNRRGTYLTNGLINRPSMTRIILPNRTSCGTVFHGG